MMPVLNERDNTMDMYKALYNMGLRDREIEIEEEEEK